MIASSVSLIAGGMELLLAVGEFFGVSVGILGFDRQLSVDDFLLGLALLLGFLFRCLTSV